MKCKQNSCIWINKETKECNFEGNKVFLEKEVIRCSAYEQCKNEKYFD